MRLTDRWQLKTLVGFSFREHAHEEVPLEPFGLVKGADVERECFDQLQKLRCLPSLDSCAPLAPETRTNTFLLQRVSLCRSVPRQTATNL